MATVQSYDFATCKNCDRQAGKPRFHIRDSIVYVCGACGFHYIDHLDNVADLARTEIKASEKGRHFDYVRAALESSEERFQSKVEVVASFKSLRGARCLDVGAGGGNFLHRIKQQGAEVHGIEPDPLNIAYADECYGIELSAQTLESPAWRRQTSSFDVVTLWDVLEHVNFPIQTLSHAVALLKPSGILCLDTPIRDSFLHRLAVTSYRLSLGRARGLLSSLYSSISFGHKQIFSSHELRCLVNRLGLELVLLRKMHELSFPHVVYLRRLLRSRTAAQLTAPLATAFFALFRIRNKAVLVARKGLP